MLQKEGRVCLGQTHTYSHSRPFLHGAVHAVFPAHAAMSLLPINPEDFPDVPTRKALIAIDLQNDFLSEDGALPVTQPDGMIDKIVSLAEAVRNSGYGEIIWVRSQFDTSRPAGEQQIMAADTPQIPLRPGSSAAAAAARSRKSLSASPSLDADPEAFLSVDGDQGSQASKSSKPQCVRKGTKGAELFPAIAAAKGPKDYAMTKSYYSAFETGQLLKLLRRQFATELYICGALSNVSVYATALAASCYGFDITIVEDCCCYRSEMRHMNAARKLTEMTGCEFSTAANVISIFRSTTPETTSKSAEKSPGASSAAPQIPAELIAAAMAATRSSPGKGIPVRPKPSPPRVNQSRSTDEEGKEERSETSTPTILSIDLPVSAEKLKLISESPVSAKTPRPATQATAAKTTTLEPENDAAQSKNRQTIQTMVKVDTIEAGDATMLKRQTGGTGELATTHKLTPKSDIRRRQSTDSSDVAQTPSKVTSNKPRKSHLTDEISPSTKTSRSRPPEFKVTEELLVAATPIHMLKGNYTRNKVARLAATESICEGDTMLVEEFLPPSLIDGLFERLCEEVQFKKMMHQGGEVPRFIAVQGEIDEDGTRPVYRHPADESPPLLPLTPAVEKIRDHVERALEHTVNHVLIQCYHGGNDYISEHSDKTLDIVPGSYIANVSLGAERTMVFRTKRGDRKPREAVEKASEPLAESDSSNKRQVVRLPMPHNSLVKMGLATNGKWLHGIKADKRPIQEKTQAELASDGVRISLTFRRIGTFLSPSPNSADGTTPLMTADATSSSSTVQSEPQYIWGQGAVSKERKDARHVINGQTTEAIAMLKAFGKENNSPEFDWDANYGCGFDVLHMKSAPRYFGCGHVVVDGRVKLMLAECGVKYAKGDIGSGPTSSTGGGGKAVIVPVKFIMDDSDRTTVVGDAAILLYLDAKHPKKRSGGDAETARVYTRFYASLALGQRWAAITAKNDKTIIADFLKTELSEFEAWAAEFSSSESENNSTTTAAAEDKLQTFHIAGGSAPSIADYALWPVLYDMTVSLSTTEEEDDKKTTGIPLPPFGKFGHEGLNKYFRSFGRRTCAVETFGRAT